jgi:hypothetical protein
MTQRKRKREKALEKANRDGQEIGPKKRHKKIQEK